MAWDVLFDASAGVDSKSWSYLRQLQRFGVSYPNGTTLIV